ncbi:MAG: hypothetical protein AXA67_10365 [Methylothermaceae bacteria B42]|nr:MAG: hypothetical protein AXA67_10365 [Methylothermaceae bacteria B42]HHJ40528.1 hypothetical protein [Methylothermaceae bacterium]
MATRELPKSQWETYFDHVSAHLKAVQAEIEVASMNLGDQIEAEWVPFYGVSYDPKDDLVEFILEGVDHLVPHPGKILVEDGPEGLHNIEVIDSEGIRHIAKFKEALKLPPPEA